MNRDLIIPGWHTDHGRSAQAWRTIMDLDPADAHELQMQLVEAHGHYPCICSVEKGIECIRHSYDKQHRMCSTRGCTSREWTVVDVDKAEDDEVHVLVNVHNVRYICVSCEERWRIEMEEDQAND